jgi:hypothetical protein
MKFNDMSRTLQTEVLDHLNQLHLQYKSYSSYDVHEMIGIDPSAAKIISKILEDTAKRLQESKEDI